ncbi:hypothetical protein MIT9_P0238 [Methylomarinovum caldicuralii]|uniref:Putative restriction endonuclease domain-containing protein n=1 Tax=Methylomarinovum caldicuralii TaxID=438856 RepID=A0AAU9C0T2_9GAMM|nr:Uma2 family endonuclease [Methylomarinovum caldicuralii]BCX80664.1 hypothetical protein MIT9_P0238 [Methylomarinovum caldicuralii]
MIAPELLPHYTWEDCRRWEGDWELIAGIPYAMAPGPTARHQRLSLKIARQLDEQLERCDDCQVLFETDWIVRDDTVVRPDVMVICGGIEGDWPTRTPRLIFEVVSPSTALRDEKLKFELYQDEGVAHYVLVYPDLRTAKVWRLRDGRFVKRADAVNETLDFDLAGDFRIAFDFSRIWP